jgi:DNA-binding response OmpR family regulator
MAAAMLSVYFRAMKRKTISKNGVRDGASFQCQTNPPQRILLADDEPMILRLHTEVLVGSGYKVDSAEDGAVAWEVLQLNSYHLLITDNEMPKVTGVDLLKKLHAARMAMPVIMTTATLPHEELSRYPWLPVEAILLKPYSVEELLSTVSNVLRTTDGAYGQLPPPSCQNQPSPDDVRL